MQDYERISKLLDAGFTAAEIRKMFTPENGSETDNKTPSSEGSSVNLPGGTEEEEGAPDSSSEAGQESETMSTLRAIQESIDKQMADFKKQFEAFNMNMAKNQEQTSKGSTEIFASLTNPPGVFAGVKGGKE